MPYLLPYLLKTGDTISSFSTAGMAAVAVALSFLNATFGAVQVQIHAEMKLQVGFASVQPSGFVLEQMFGFQSLIMSNT